MLSTPLPVEVAGRYRITVTFTPGRSAEDHVDLMWRANPGHRWELKHTFRAGTHEIELCLEAGETLLAYSPGELSKRVAATIQPVKPPPKAPTLLDRIAALERGSVAKTPETAIVPVTLN